MKNHIVQGFLNIYLKRGCMFYFKLHEATKFNFFSVSWMKTAIIYVFEGAEHENGR